MPIVNEDFTQDPIQEIKDPLKEEESVSEKDIFRLAKSILFACLGLYALVLILFACLGTDSYSGRSCPRSKCPSKSQQSKLREKNRSALGKDDA